MNNCTDDIITYPDQVEQFLDTFERGLQEQLFYTEGPGSDTDSATVRKLFGQVALKHWLDCGTAYITDVEFAEVMPQCVFETTLNKLVEKQLVDVIENESGEQVVFLTKLGWECANTLNQQNPNLVVHPVANKPF